jgi:hypothetical protein
MAVELARSYGARITAVTPEDPYSPAGASVGAMLFDPYRHERQEAYRIAIDDFEDQIRGTDICVCRVPGPRAGAGLYSLLAAHDLAVMPAGSGLDGSEEGWTSEVASLVAKERIVPVLRVGRKPWSVNGVVLVVGSASRCALLAQRFLCAGLWPEASVSLLPVGHERPSVLSSVKAQVELLQAHGRRTVVLPALSLDFEEEDMLPLVSRFPVAVLGQLSHRGGHFDRVRNDAFEVAAECCPLILLPS